MRRRFYTVLICFIACCFFACGARKTTKNTSNANDTSSGLKDRYARFFPIGVAVSQRSLQGRDSTLIMREFNSITPENDMKMGPIHPAENRYNWQAADAIVAFAQRNHLRVRGHNLCWHSQAPSWMFTDSSGKLASKELLLKRLKEHITQVVTRYKGKLYAWDVVNEAVSDKAGEYLRPSQWLTICGEEYIAAAFRYAHEADPSAVLFYNDYNEISPVKREKIYRLVKELKDAKVPIHGVGLQAHWAVNEPSREQLDSTIKRFVDLGLQVQITEMDISVYPKEHDARERRPEDSFTKFTTEREQQQLDKYRMSFELFRKYRKSLSGVTFWNISDRSTWLDNFPVRNRKDYPLLFDTVYQRKNAYGAVTAF